MMNHVLGGWRDVPSYLTLIVDPSRRTLIPALVWGCLAWACTPQSATWGRCFHATVLWLGSTWCTTSARVGPVALPLFTSRGLRIPKRYWKCWAFYLTGQIPVSFSPASRHSFVFCLSSSVSVVTFYVIVAVSSKWNLGLALIVAVGYFFSFIIYLFTSFHVKFS